MNVFKEVHLTEVADLEMGSSPGSNFVNQTGEGVPFLQGSGQFRAEIPEHTSYCTRPTKTCEPNAILLSVRAPVGDVNRADQTYAIGRGLAAIHFDDEDARFGWHLMQFCSSRLEKYAYGTTFKAVKRDHLQELTVPWPPPSERNRIAQVLDTVDAAIQRTDRVVDKLEHVRQGLLHDLLTRGLTANGPLRDPETHPEQFRGSSLGRIPEAYDLVPLGELIVEGPRNGIYKPESAYEESGNRIVRIDSFYGGVIRSQESLKRVQLTDQEIRKYGLSEGDILINRVNSIDYLGKSAYVPDLHEPTVFESNMMRFRVDESRSLPKYVGMQLGSPIVQRQIRRCAKHAVAQASVNQEDVGALLFPLPEIDEQKRVLRRYEAHERRENAESRRGRKLKSLKRGLMLDLLSGEVRITEDVERRVAEVTSRSAVTATS